MSDIKAIYQANNLEIAAEALEQFKQNWGDKYRSVVESWQTNWDHLSTFLNYPQEIRRLIYTPISLKVLTPAYVNTPAIRKCYLMTRQL